MTGAHLDADLGADRGASAEAASAALQVLVVDDHPRIREPLAHFLRRHGLVVHTAGDAREMHALLALKRFDAVVLDVMLPDGDGSLLCAQLRADHGTAVLLLTARGEVEDRVHGLERGADDYVVKPFDPRELLARIRSVVRRHPGPASAPASVPVPASALPAPAARAGAAGQGRRYLFDGWQFDAARARLVTPEGEIRSLSDAEARLLEVLVCYPHAVLDRDQLLDLTRAQGRDGDPAFDRTIDRQISRLRRKLQTQAAPSGVLRTVRGNGYSFVAQVQRPDA